LAKATVKMPEDFLKKISGLGSETDRITTKALEAGAQVMYQVVKANLQSVIGMDRSKNTKYENTGQLIYLLGVTPTEINNKGNTDIKIGWPKVRIGRGSMNTRYRLYAAGIATILEYGKHNQKARPFMAPAIRKNKDRCLEVMTQTLESEIARL